MENEIKPKNRNASPSAFGWAFQTAAGIFLMLENIKEIERIKIEGKYEDIEIWLPNEKIYAQAKSTSKMGTPSNINQILKKAFDSLNDDYAKSDKPVRELIYISNFDNPINSKISNLFNEGAIYGMEDLNEIDASRIQSLLGTNVPKDIVKIRILRFNGQGTSKFVSLKREIENFLYKSINDARLSDSVFNYWYFIFDADAGDRPVENMHVDISKDQIIWPIISSILSIEHMDDDEYFKICKDHNLDSILETYRNFIKDRIFDFAFTSRVVNPYNEYLSIHGRSPSEVIDFIDSYWSTFYDDFSSISDEVEREELIKIIMYKIICNSRKLEKLKKASNL